MTLTELSIKRPPLIIVLFLFLIILGIVSYQKMSYELLPDVTPPMVSVSVVYPGASPQEVETSITKKIEDAVNNLEKIKRVTSWSYESMGMIFIEFNRKAVASVALQEVQRKVNEVLAELPKEAKAPVVSKFSIRDIPVLRIAATGGMEKREFYKFLKDDLKPRLSRIDGVGQVFLIGGAEREIKINIDRNKLLSRKITILEVLEKIKNSNMDVPAGNVKDNIKEFTVRLTGKLTDLNLINEIVIKDDPVEGKIKLRDIALIDDGEEEQKNYSRLNKMDAIGVFIQKQTDANAVDVCNNVREELLLVEKENEGKDIKFNVAQDISAFTMESANAVKFDLAFAIVLVGLVMLLFLHSIRNSLIIMVAIPCSLISTFIAMYMMNFTLNIMTLLALSLVIGILVDDSIVVLENIYHHLEKGKEKVRASIDGRNEIGFTALSITLVDVVVFLPLALIEGMVGNIVRQFSLVIVVSTLLSLFVSFTITPMLASKFSKLENINKNTMMGKFAAWFEAKFRSLAELYAHYLQIALNHKGKVITLSIIMLFASFSLVGFGFVGGEFINPTDKGEMQMIIELEPGAKLSRTNQVTRQIENDLLAQKEITKILTNVGSSEEGMVGLTSSNVTEFIITLVPKEKRDKGLNELGRVYKQIAESYPGVKAKIAPISIFGSADMGPVAVGIAGADYAKVLTVSEKIKKVFEAVPGTSDIQKSVQTGKPEVQVKINREKMAALGLGMEYVGGELRVALHGDNDSKLRDGYSEYNIRVFYDEYYRGNPEQIENMIFINDDGEKIYLKQFADVVFATGPSKLERKYRNSSVTVTSRAVGRPSGDIGEELKQKIAALNIPSDIKITYENDLEAQDESFESLSYAFIAAILFVYLILAALYNSFIYPLTVLLTIPLAVIGAITGLALAMENINIMSLLGMIVLTGLVGKNAILLVDRINQNRSNNLGMEEAILESARSRIRPILMTTLTLILGVVPIAVAKGASNELKTGMAIVLIGGLSSSLFLTLFLIPVMYVKIEQFRNFLLKIKSKFVKPADTATVNSSYMNTIKILLIAGMIGFTATQTQAQTLKLSANEAVSYAFKNNQELKIAAMSNKQSEYRKTEAYSYLYPEIQAEGRYIRNTKLPVMYLPGSFVGDTTGAFKPMEMGEKNVYEGMLKFQMPLFNYSVYSGIRSAGIAELISKQNERIVKNKINADVRKAYYSVLIAEAKYKLVNQSIDRAEQRFADTKLLYKTGFAADFDTLTAYINYINLIPVRIKTENVLTNCKDMLRFLLNIDKKTEIELTDSFVYEGYSAPDFSSSLIYALENKPEMKQLELSTDLAEQQKISEFSQHFPTLSAFGQLRIEAQSNNYDFSKYNWPTSSHAGLQINIPLFSGFRISAKTEQAEIEKKKMIEQYDNEKKYLTVELNAAIMELGNTQKNVETRKRVVELAERNYLLIQSKYKKGLLKLSDLQDAELVLNESKTNYIEELFNSKIAQIEYEKCIGKIILE